MKRRMRKQQQYLLIQRRLQVQGAVRHQEAPGRLHHGLRARLLRGILDLPDHQAHRVPETHSTMEALGTLGAPELWWDGRAPPGGVGVELLL